MWNNNKEYLQVQIYPCGYILKKFSQVDFSPFLTYLFIYLFGQHYSLSLIKKNQNQNSPKALKKMVVYISSTLILKISLPKGK